ncbi:hypothetical protein [Methanococcoides sp. LMO-2]|uniref:Uncharacterized protein n=1 Tax=Methanococcoides cohabitans TaxID=3136559 RepID=A0ABU9KZS6_9EURY
MTETNQQEQKKVEEKDIADILNQITPFVETLAPKIIEYQKMKSPEIKRAQYMDFIIMILILIAITILTYCKLIDGSAATGLLGAVIGYVFGTLYKKEE